MHGNKDGEPGVNNDTATQGFEGIGAYILAPTSTAKPNLTWRITFEAEAPWAAVMD